MNIEDVKSYEHRSSGRLRLLDKDGNCLHYYQVSKQDLAVELAKYGLTVASESAAPVVNYASGPSSPTVHPSQPTKQGGCRPCGNKRTIHENYTNNQSTNGHPPQPNQQNLGLIDNSMTLTNM